MFKTFINAILISVMVLVDCEESLIIQNDRIYRYVGKPSEKVNLSQDSVEDKILNTHESKVKPKLQQNINDRSEEIPESILIQLKEIKDSSDFIASFLTPSANINTNANKKEVFLQYLQRGNSESPSNNEMTLTEDRKKLNKLPKISKPAGCEPEMRVIELQPKNTRNELYFPSCIRMPRCSGCCPSQRLQCVPISTSFEDITVIRVKYSSSENRLKFEGFKVFRIEKHDNCSCDCIQKASDCGRNQIFSSSECRCVCPDILEINNCQMDTNKFWDYPNCQCKCKSFPLCSTGFLFDNTTCRCESEEETTNTSYDSNYSLDRNSSKIETNRYNLGNNDYEEMKAQRSKGLELFDKKGINPGNDEEYYDHT